MLIARMYAACCGRGRPYSSREPTVYLLLSWHLEILRFLCCLGIKGLIWRARGYMFRCEIGRKTIELLFTRQLRWQPLL